MTKLDFASFHNRFAGRPGWVIGRGPTQYQYQNLAAVEGPVFFINDSVSQEVHLAANCPSFFFAHDINMAVWLGAIRSTAVLVIDFPYTAPDSKGLINGSNDALLQGEGNVVLYSQYGEYDQSRLLERSRFEIARCGQLYMQNGTIHPLLHFAWYVGCSKLYLIGCDGLPNVGYDLRLPNLSGSKQFGALYIRWNQDKMLRALGLPVEYVGTPSHLVQLEYTLTIQKHNEDKLLEMLPKVMLFAQKTNGGVRATLQCVDNSDSVIHLKLQSNDVRLLLDCMECTITPELRALENDQFISLKTELF